MTLRLRPYFSHSRSASAEFSPSTSMFTLSSGLYNSKTEQVFDWRKVAVFVRNVVKPLLSIASHERQEFLHGYIIERRNLTQVQSENM